MTKTGSAPQRHGLKQERAVRTYAQILHAASEIFAARGFAEVTLVDIAEHAGVTKGAVYFHFANKEAIAVAVSEEYYARLPTLAAGVQALDLPPLDATVELLTRIALALRDDHVFQAAVRLHIEHFLIEGGLPTPFVSYTELVRQLLERADELGQLQPGTSPEALARVLVAAFFGAQHISWVLHGRRDIMERVQEVITAIVPTQPGGLVGSHVSRAGQRSRTPETH
jgi:AcrR family transcriptional regulator